MTKIFRIIIRMLMCLVLAAGMLFSVSAKNENSSGIICVSRGGDTALYESCTKEAILSAFEKGADYVSVNVRKTEDGMFIICGADKTQKAGIALDEMLSLLGGDDVLILDFEYELKDEIYSLIENENAFSSAILRINDSANSIVRWLEDKNESLQVVGIYDGFVVFTAVSHIKALGGAGMQIAGYQSKNYFNEMFGSLVSKTLKQNGMPKAMISTYDPDLCGQRSDSEDGWNDLIKKGYSIIETGNLDAFLRYISSNKQIRTELGDAYEKAQLVETDIYNTVSRENLNKAMHEAGNLLESSFASSDEMQSVTSKLRLAMENLALKTGEDTQTGALNITAGKVIAAVLVGVAVLVAQIYTYKMQKHKKK